MGSLHYPALVDVFDDDDDNLVIGEPYRMEISGDDDHTPACVGNAVEVDLVGGIQPHEILALRKGFAAGCVANDGDIAVINRSVPVTVAFVIANRVACFRFHAVTLAYSE